MDPEKDNTTALQYLEVTVSIGTGTVSLPSVLSFYFDLFTLSLPVALQSLVFDCLNLQSNHGAKDPAATVQGVHRTDPGNDPRENVAGLCPFSSMPIIYVSPIRDTGTAIREFKKRHSGSIERVSEYRIRVRLS